MGPRRARVQKGRLVLNEPTGLPIALLADDEVDDLTADERHTLHETLRASWKSAEAGPPPAGVGHFRRVAAAL